MGMYDALSLFMSCPICGKWATFTLQTKDLECELYTYQPLDEDWFTNEDAIIGRPLRVKLPVFPSFPFDKSATVWENQAERVEAKATPTKEIGEQLKFIVAYGSCSNCEAEVEGKIKIENGFLMKPLYDITTTEKEVKQ